jgi:ABC-type multidrug transport system ATPase subunit
MIRADNLWKKFGRHEALRGLSFSVPEGSAYTLIGANGAGKTTAIRILMNILELDMSKIMETAQSVGGPPTNEGMFEAVVSAIQDEPGLKVAPTKAPIEILVIDHAEKPSEN